MTVVLSRNGQEPLTRRQGDWDSVVEPYSMHKHSRATLIIILICVVFLDLNASVLAETPKEAPFLLGGEYTLSAEETSFSDGLIHAAGTVRFQTGGVEVFADALIIDVNQGMVQARGKVTLTSSGNQVIGDDLVYYWRANTGSLKHISLETGGYRVKAEAGEFDLSTEIIVLKQASFTRCDLSNPDYRFLASRLVVEKKRLSAQGVSLELFGLRLLPILPLTIPLAPERLRDIAQGNLPLPQVTPEEDGFLAEIRQLNILDERTMGIGRIGYSTNDGIRLGGRVFRVLGDEGLLEIDGDYKLSLQQGLLAAQVMWPETNGYSLRGELGFQEVTGTEDGIVYGLYFNPHLTVTTPAFFVGLGSIRLQGDTGRMTETGPDSKISSSFSQARMDAGFPLINLQGFGLSGQGFLEQDWYGNGLQRTMGQVAVTLEKPVTPGLTLRVSPTVRQVEGVSPFKSQAVSSLRSVDLGMSANVSSVNVNGTLRYDLDRHLFSEAGTDLVYRVNNEWQVSANLQYLLPEQRWDQAKLSLSRDLHCFDFSVSYDLIDNQMGANFSYKL